MKAIIYTEYGPPEVLQPAEVAKPTPQDNEVLIKIHTTTVNAGDLMARKFNSYTPRTFTMPALFWLMARLDFGWNSPKKPTLGSQFAGVVESVGKDVTLFKVGDPVWGYPGQSMGAYAEYICMPEDGRLTLKPANIPDEEATTIPYGALTALNLLKKMDIQPGQKVLINGASGGIGSAAVQLAKHYGAEVTGVCGTPRVEFVKALGADHVIDYTREDFTQNGESYDLILDILGKTPFARSKGSLKPGGRYLLATFKMKQIFQMLWTSLFSDKKVICALAVESTEDLRHIKELVEAGTITTVIDRIFPLSQTAEAHRYAESGQKTGNIVIQVTAGSH